MDILFLSLGKYNTIYQSGIYTDLLREFAKQGHNLFVISALEKRDGDCEQLIIEERCSLVRVYTGNIQKTGLIEKGCNTLLIERRYINAIKKYFNGVKFDLVLYPTPPITICKVVEFIQKRDSAKTYLLLKDIFPQNAVDIGMMNTTGVSGLLYKFFRNKEKKLYAISDHIGCMSQANVDYLLEHNPEVHRDIVEICPNSIECVDMSVDKKTRDEIRIKYDIPLYKKVFVYGGNLGKPQGIDFMIKCLKSHVGNEEAFFLIVGDGTEYGLIENYINRDNPANVKLMQRLPKDDYDKMVAACDVGMIFLDYRFTIPNFPSRLLSYLQAKLPVLAVTDTNTDIGKTIVEGGFGWWCESNSISAFSDTINDALASDTDKLGLKGFEYLNNNYTVKKAAETILKALR